MVGFGSFRGRLFASARFGPVMVMVCATTIHLVAIDVVVVVGFLALAFCTWPFGFPVTATVTLLFPERSLTLRSRVAIDSTREAFFAHMDLWDILQPVIAIDVLPGLTLFAEDRIAIVIVVGADATNGIRFLLFWDGRIDTGTVEGGLRWRDGDRIRLRA